MLNVLKYYTVATNNVKESNIMIKSNSKTICYLFVPKLRSSPLHHPLMSKLGLRPYLNYLKIYINRIILRIRWQLYNNYIYAIRYI